MFWAIILVMMNNEVFAIKNIIANTTTETLYVEIVTAIECISSNYGLIALCTSTL